MLTKKSKNMRLKGKHNKQEAWLGYFANKTELKPTGLNNMTIGDYLAKQHVE